MKTEDFLSKVNAQLGKRFKMVEAKNAGEKGDPLIIVLNVNTGTIVAYFNFCDELVYGLHAEGSIYDLLQIMTVIKKVVDSEEE